MSETGFKRIGNATAVPSGQGLLIPRSGTGGGGEYGADITHDLRAFAATREPVAYRTIFTVAHDIFDNWFTLEKEGADEGDSQSGLFDKRIQQELSRLNAKSELTRMAVLERCFGWAIIVLGYVDAAESLADELTSPQRLQEIKAYGPRQVTVSNTDLDTDVNSERYGLPVFYNVKRDGTTGDMRVHYTRVIHTATRLMDDGDWKGISVLDAIWDDINVLRNIRWGMGQTMYRYGSGFPDITFTGAELSDIENWEDSGAFANLNARTYFAHSEDQTIEFKGLQGHTLDPMNYYLPPMEHISCGSGIPLAILRGAQAGTLTGSEVNQGEYYGLISDEQSGYEPTVRELIYAILGFMPDKRRVNPPSFVFNWGSGIELSDTEKQSIALQRAQELDYLWNFKTRNEIREMIDSDLPKLKREDGGEDFKTLSGKPVEADLMPFGATPKLGPDGKPLPQTEDKELPPQLQKQIDQGEASYIITEINPPRKPRAVSS